MRITYRFKVTPVTQGSPKPWKKREVQVFLSINIRQGLEFGDIAPEMENQMGGKRKHEMETGLTW